MTGKAVMMIRRKEENWRRRQICCLDRRQPVMDNPTAEVSCFARSYHFENNKTHIFADNMATRLLEDDYVQLAESMMQGIN